MEKKIEYLILIGITLGIATIIVLILRKVLNYFIKNGEDPLRPEVTNLLYINNSLSFLVYTTAIMWIFYKIPYFNSLGTAMFAGAGILAAIIGFASQKAFSNIIGGIFILIFKPFQVGDAIELGSGKRGIVEEITLRHTIIKDYEWRRVVIPNNILSDDTIINSNLIEETIRKHIEFGISYDSDLQKAIEIIVAHVKVHPLFVDLRTEEEIAENAPVIEVRVVSWADSAVVLRAYVTVLGHENGFAIQTDLYKSVKL